jgi:hypothetical protein
MLHALDVRDAMDSERFQQVQFDPVSLAHNSSTLNVGALADTVSKEQSESHSAFYINFIAHTFLTAC